MIHERAVGVLRRRVCSTEVLTDVLASFKRWRAPQQRAEISSILFSSSALKDVFSAAWAQSSI